MCVELSNGNEIGENWTASDKCVVVETKSGKKREREREKAHINMSFLWLLLYLRDHSIDIF